MALEVARASLVSIEWPLEGERAPSILETLEHLQRTRKDELPKELRVNEEDRSTIGYDDWKDLSEIPVIDLSLLQTDRAVKQLHKAVSEWGFFHILNHGIPLELMQEVQAQGLKFFALPPEIKKKATPEPGCSVGLSVGYTGDNSKKTRSNLHWAENLTLNSLLVDRTVSKVWPDGNEEFRHTVTEYSAGVERVGKQLLELIAESLGLSTDFFAQHYPSKVNTVRYNLYPACPTPMECMGVMSHTDPGCITVLMLDNVGGLQIEKDGQWLAVRPIEGSLVVNIGDTLHHGPAGIERTDKSYQQKRGRKYVLRHGATAFAGVCCIAEWSTNNSIVFQLLLSLYVDEDVPISAPEELIDANHPRRYRTVTVREYRSQYPSRVEAKRSNGESFLKEAYKFEE